MADITSTILTSLLSSSNIKKIGKESGASAADVKSVLTSALPSLLQGASAQANGTSTAASFLKAITEHAGNADGKIDLNDGMKIVSHLLGSGEAKTESTIAKEAGVSKDMTKSILAAAAPLLMSVLGNQTNASSSNASAIGSLLSSAVSGNMGSILTGLLGGSTTASSSKPSTSKPAASGGKADLANAAVNLLGSLLK